MLEKLSFIATLLHMFRPICSFPTHPSIRLSTLARTSIRTSSSKLELVPEVQWRAEAISHRARVRSLVGGDLTNYDGTNPIYNFLFRYYFWKPSAVASYSPGWNKVLLGALDTDVSHGGGQRRASVWTSGGGQEHGLFFDGSRCSPDTLLGLQNTLDLLRATESRPPSFNCFGMHEWAMLYTSSSDGQAGEPHQHLPLRLPQAALNAAVLERGPLKCTHFDAFRFFTPAAVPLNQRPLARSTQASSDEQPGCVHANMDLFKWAMKLAPWVDAQLVGDCLELARDARLLDMRASPYDLEGMTPEQRRIWSPAPAPHASVVVAAAAAAAAAAAGKGSVSALSADIGVLGADARFSQRELEGALAEVEAAEASVEAAAAAAAAAAVKGGEPCEVAVEASRSLRKAKSRARRSKAKASKLESLNDGHSKGVADSLIKLKVVGEFDVSPIRVETAEGRQRYQWEQEALWRRAQPVRRRVIEAYENFLVHAVEVLQPEKMCALESTY